MDDAIGEIAVGDVLVERGRIATVAPSISAEDVLAIDARGCVVIPGLVDTHRHTWQTLMRAICADWTLTDYFLGMRLTISPAYRPDDVFLGNRLGALEALDAGVTTLVDFSHCMNTPEHADAALEGIRDAGGRAVHAYGFFASAPGNPAFPTHTSRLDDFARVVRAHGSGHDRVVIGAALTEIATIPWRETEAEIETARRHNAPMVLHTGCVWGSVVTMGVREMHAHDLLGPDQVHVHANTLDDDEWRMLADSGGKVSISPETELNMGMGRPAFGACTKHGIRPTLSCDIISLNSGDLFAQMRLGLASARADANDVVNRRGAMPASLVFTARDALRWATINGAAACGLEARVGSITPGKRADLVVLGGANSLAFRRSQEPIATVVFQATARDVRDVVVDGRIVKRDGALVDVDLPALLRGGDDAAERILAKVRERVPSLPPRPGFGFEGLEDGFRRNLAQAATLSGQAIERGTEPPGSS